MPKILDQCDEETDVWFILRTFELYRLNQTFLYTLSAYLYENFYPIVFFDGLAIG